jgi:hypothetical protein
MWLSHPRKRPVGNKTVPLPYAVHFHRSIYYSSGSPPVKEILIQPI